MKNKINTKCIVLQNKDHLISSELGEDLVMMDIESGSYISLNKTGRTIWEFIQEPIKVSELIIRLVEKYQIDESTCTLETLYFLNNLDKQNKIVVL